MAPPSAAGCAWSIDFLSGEAVVWVWQLVRKANPEDRIEAFPEAAKIAIEMMMENLRTTLDTILF